MTRDWTPVATNLRQSPLCCGNFRHFLDQGFIYRFRFTGIVKMARLCTGKFTSERIGGSPSSKVIAALLAGCAKTP